MINIDFKLKGKCGIYSIFNMSNGKRYIGSSVDLYKSNTYIPIIETAVLIEESSELPSGNIGRNPDMDNTEISLEITQGSKPS